jgi:hypothetical protein
VSSRYTRCARWLIPHEKERGLFRMFCAGVLVILVGCALSTLVGVRQGLWDFVEPPRVERGEVCDQQFASLKGRREELQKERDVYAKRRVDLEGALVDSKNPAFLGAPAALEVEEARGRSIASKLKALKVESIDEFMPKLVIGVVLVSVFAFLTARLAAAHGVWALGGKWSLGKDTGRWRLPYWAIVTTIFIVHGAREVFTSVFTRDKSWLVWCSFCVSTWAWAFMLVTALGFAMVTAYPATILWHFGRDTNRPEKLNSADKDGQWGVGRYVSFLQAWSNLSLALFALPASLWLRAYRDDLHLQLPYLLTGAALFAAVLIVIGRFIRNAIKLRQAYKKKVLEAGKDWHQIQEAKLPPDPTIDFIGENWWKLPAVISSIFALSWLIATQVGVSDFLQQLLGVR